jgi:hypothetical protein
MNKQAKERVLIAKDALKWIKAGALIPKSLVYVDAIENTELELRNSKNFGKQLRDMYLGKCRVCAKGALFLAKAVRYDNVVITANFDISDLAADHVEGPLNDHFSTEQLRLIEWAFEGFNCDELGWLRRYEKASERLVAILNNIVRNEGSLLP